MKKKTKTYYKKKLDSVFYEAVYRTSLWSADQNRRMEGHNEGRCKNENGNDKAV